jgi:hypothetical protein
MEQEIHNKWDIRAKFITLVLTIVTVFVGICQFNREQRNIVILQYKLLAANDSIKAVNRLWEQKIQVYSDIGTSVGSILSCRQQDTVLDNQIQKFEILYYGEALIVEDSSVNKMMSKFKQDIDAYKGGFLSLFQLKIVGMALSKRLRENISEKRQR